MTSLPYILIDYNNYTITTFLDNILHQQPNTKGRNALFTLD